MRKFLGRGLWLQLVVLLCGLFLLTGSAQAGFMTDFTNSVHYDYEGMVAAFQGLHGNGYSPLSEEQLAQLDMNMQGMNLPQGWYQADTKTYGKYLWLFNGLRGGEMVPVKGFGFHLEDGKIKDIFWCVYLPE
ncbi:MAG: hypothetical protein LKF34_01545 [Acidaminococcaceae bacterium]|nr:hypothetical protein [Acidaminococcaceae bacterium]